jgi:putative transposase
MPRIARVVVPGLPHHVTQRGVRRMDVFFSDEDRFAYLAFLAKQARAHGVEFLAWCLMTNHIHLVATPNTESSLAKGIGEAHKRYSRMINSREGWRGYLFQGRFFSCPIEPTALLGVVRYVLRNPVRAGIACEAWEYPWSSARWLVGNASSDPLVKKKGSLVEVDDWRSLLAYSDNEVERIRKHTRTGRPMGGESFITQLEHLLERKLRKKKPGPTPRR